MQKQKCSAILITLLLGLSTKLVAELRPPTQAELDAVMRSYQSYTVNSITGRIDSGACYARATYLQMEFLTRFEIESEKAYLGACQSSQLTPLNEDFLDKGYSFHVAIAFPATDELTTKNTFIVDPALTQNRLQLFPFSLWKTVWAGKKASYGSVDNIKQLLTYKQDIPKRGKSAQCLDYQNLGVTADAETKIPIGDIVSSCTSLYADIKLFYAQLPNKRNSKARMKKDLNALLSQSEFLIRKMESMKRLTKNPKGAKTMNYFSQALCRKLGENEYNSFKKMALKK